MQEEKENKNFLKEIEDMRKANLAWGCSLSRTHPKIREFLLGIKNYISIFDLKKTNECLTKALKFIKELTKEKKTILFVGLSIPSKEPIKKTAEKLKFPYINESWPGGFLTNFSEIKKRIEYFKNLEKMKESGQIDSYPIKEKLDLLRDLNSLKKKFAGVRELEKLPEAIFLVCSKETQIVINEARRKGIPTIGIVGADFNPELVDFPIPANNRSKSAIEFILNKVEKLLADKK